MGSTDEENFVICLREMFPQDGSKDVEIRNEKSQEVDEFIKTNKNKNDNLLACVSEQERFRRIEVSQQKVTGDSRAAESQS